MRKANSGKGSATITPGFSLHKEMQLWNKAGVSEIDILRTVTAKSSVIINDTVGFVKKI